MYIWKLVNAAQHIDDSVDSKMYLIVVYSP